MCCPLDSSQPVASSFSLYLGFATKGWSLFQSFHWDKQHLFNLNALFQLIFLSLKYQPTLLILDDPCTFLAHIFCTEPALSKLLFGTNRGCFEAPHKTKTPKSNHDCPELLPLPYNHRNVDRSALENPLGKVHPISGKIPRKVLGTKLSESHKKHNECSFHNINLCLQSAHIKVLLQGVRKTWNATFLHFYHCCQ